MKATYCGMQLEGTAIEIIRFMQLYEQHTRLRKQQPWYVPLWDEV